MRQLPAPWGRSLLAAITCLAIGVASTPSRAAAQSAALRIVVLEGEDSVNLIDKKTAVKPTIEVRDRNDLPVSGAVVRFGINGRGAVFENGVRQVTVTTDTLGRATVNTLTPVSKGTVDIQVQASYQGQTATATIHQANFANAAQATQAGKTVPQAGQSASGGSAGSGGAGAAAGGGAAAATGGLSTAAIVGIAAGGAAAGIGTAVAVSSSSSSSSANTPTAPPAPPPLNLTGTWNVTLTQAGAPASSGVIRLSQTGNSITGQDVTPNPYLTGGGLSGGVTVSYTNNITGTISGNAVPLTWTGTSSATDGEFTATCSFTANLMLTAANSSSLSGSWTATLSCGTTPATAPPDTLTNNGSITMTKQQ
jgi:hypothetical protein